MPGRCRSPHAVKLAQPGSQQHHVASATSGIASADAILVAMATYARGIAAPVRQAAGSAAARIPSPLAALTIAPAREAAPDAAGRLRVTRA